MLKSIKLESKSISRYNQTNPLDFLTERNLKQIINQARNGNIGYIQFLYKIVEKSCLTLKICKDRRISGLGDWIIKRKEKQFRGNFDSNLAIEQEDFLLKQFYKLEENNNLQRVIDHLGGAIFRGISVIEPIYSGENIEKINIIDSENIVIDYAKQDDYGNFDLYWNPHPNTFFSFSQNDLQKIPEGQVLQIFNESPIDNFALQIFLLEQLGYDSYSKIIARRGLPNTILVAPENLPEEQFSEWARSAEEIAKGGCGIVPYGTEINQFNLDSSSAGAIKDFIDHLQREIVLASTGGTLTSLSENTGLGSNLGKVQDEVFKSICKKDNFLIGSCLNQIAQKLLKIKYPNQNHLVYFDLESDSTKSNNEILDELIKANQLGFSVSADDLSQKLGYNFVKNDNINQNNEWSPMDLIKNNKKIVEKDNETIVENSVETIEEEDDLSEEEKKFGNRFLSAFAKMIEPIKSLIEKFTKSDNEDEKKEILEEIDETIEKSSETEDEIINLYIENLQKTFN